MAKYKVERTGTRGGIYEIIVDIVGICSGIIFNFGDTPPTSTDIQTKVDTWVAQLNSHQAQQGTMQYVSVIDEDLAASKERLKWVAISYMQANPTSIAAELMATLSWQDAGVASSLIAIYANQAVSQGLVTINDDTLDSCYTALLGLIVNLTETQIKELLA